MPPKRPLGLGKSAKERAKKQKKEQDDLTSGSATPVPQQSKSESTEAEGAETEQDQGQDPSQAQLTVELDETVDPNDELSQLKALWKTYMNSNRDNELMLNGIIHESDRLLRASSVSENSSSESVKIDEEFHAIYALALAELAKFNKADPEEEDGGDQEQGQVAEFFDAAIERAELGLEKYENSVLLKYVLSTVEINRIPLEYISAMDMDSKKKKFPEIKQIIDRAMNRVDRLKCGVETVDIVNDFYNSMDDLIDIIANFGTDLLEGLDSDDEEEEEEEEEEVEDEEPKKDIEVPRDHPLYEIRQDLDQIKKWWKDSLQKSYNSTQDPQLGSRLGRAYLQEAELPTQVFTSLKYDEEFEDVDEIDGMDVITAQETAMKYCQLAIPLLEKACDESKPETLVNLSECLINLANLYEVDSKEQENLYKQAETKLRKANNITHGRYQDILNNLLEK